MLVLLLDVRCNGSILPGADHLPLLISAPTNLVNSILEVLVVNFSNASHGVMWAAMLFPRLQVGASKENSMGSVTGVNVLPGT